MENELIRQRLEYLKSERKSTQEQVWINIERYICPYRGNFEDESVTENSIDVSRQYIYDGTALQAQQNLAANLHGNLTSPFFRWFQLRFRDEEMNEDTDAREWLETVAETMWQALLDSDFSLEISEIYMDLTTYATGALIEEGGENGIDFTAVPLKEVYFEEGAKGQVLTFYRLLNWTYQKIVDKFGPDGVPPEVLAKLDTPSGCAERTDVIFCVYARSHDPQPSFKKLAPKRRPWGYKYILAKDASLLGKEGGYHEMPAAIVRWSKISESKWGHGPSHIAIYDAMTLNRQEELTLQALAKIVDPPMVTTERGLIGDLDMSPGGLTVVKNIGDLVPLQPGTDWGAVNNEREMRRNMLREYYFANRLDLKESPAMTATEVERRWQQMQKLLGPTLGRLQAELLDPVIKITFSTMWRNGLLPPIPASMANMSPEMDIEYTGPIPLAQKQDIGNSIEREMSFAGGIAQVFGPDVLDVLNPSEAVREHAFLSGVPAKVIRSKAEIAKLKKERDAAQKKQAAMAEAQQGAAAAKDMGAAAKGMSDAGMDPEEMMANAQESAQQGPQ
jgi:hypothetical protein